MASSEAGARAKIVQRGYEAFQTGDMDTLRSLFTSDISWHSPAQGSGEWHGVDDVMAEFARLFEDTGGTFRVTVNEVTTGDESVVVLARATATRGGKTLDSAYAHVFHFRGELVSEAWVVNYDQALPPRSGNSEVQGASTTGAPAHRVGCRPGSKARSADALPRRRSLTPAGESAFRRARAVTR